jgi:DNA modification methylase
MLIQADAFHLPYRNNLFHACVTSPPYWGLRKYSGEQGEEPLGLEPTPERYIERMVEICREIGRVLRPDGVFWLNIGDCYSGSGKGAANWSGTSGKQATNIGSLADGAGLPVYKDIAAGNLMLIPQRLVIALQQDGWIVRNDVVWYKRNPMPEPMRGWRFERSRKKIRDSKASQDWGKGDNTDILGDRHQGINEDWLAEYEYGEDYVLRKSSWRHTKAHEYIFMLTKQMQYCCDQEAVREANVDPSRTNYKPGPQAYSEGNVHDDSGRARRNEGFQAYAEGKACIGRNPRSVLDVPTASYKGAHHATFPPKLIAPLIQASVPRRACPECGQAFAPVVDKGEPTFGQSSWGLEGRRHFDMDSGEMVETGLDEGSTLKHDVPRTVLGYRPTCDHYPDINSIEIPDGLHPNRETEYRLWFINKYWKHVPGIVLDTFGGSGTTGMVAKQLMRRWVVMDISMPYIDEQAKVRTGEGTPSIGLTGLPLFDGLPK